MGMHTNTHMHTRHTQILTPNCHWLHEESAVYFALNVKTCLSSAVEDRSYRDILYVDLVIYKRPLISAKDIWHIWGHTSSLTCKTLYLSLSLLQHLLFYLFNFNPLISHILLPLLLFFLHQPLFCSSLLSLLSLSPSSFSERLNSTQKDTDCPEKPNYRGRCHCGQSGPKQAPRTPTRPKIELCTNLADVRQCSASWSVWRDGFDTKGAIISWLHPYVSTSTVCEFSCCFYWLPEARRGSAWYNTPLCFVCGNRIGSGKCLRLFCGHRIMETGQDLSSESLSGISFCVVSYVEQYRAKELQSSSEAALSWL